MRFSGFEFKEIFRTITTKFYGNGSILIHEYIFFLVLLNVKFYLSIFYIEDIKKRSGNKNAT